MFDTTLLNLVQELWLSPKEATTYLTIYAYGPVSAWTVARITTYKRTSVYSLIEWMLIKNIIIAHSTWTKKRYEAVSPLQILEKRQSHIQTLQSQIGSQKLAFESLRGAAVSNSAIMHYQGFTEVKKYYAKIIHHADQLIHSYLGVHDYNEFTERLNESFVPESRRKGLKVRTLISTGDDISTLENYKPLAKNTPGIHTDDMWNQTGVLYDSVNLFENWIDLFGDWYVWIVNYDKRPYSVTMFYNKSLYNSLLSSFNLLWNTLKVVEK